MRRLSESAFWTMGVGLALFGLGACSSLPNSGPSAQDIVQQQAAAGPDGSQQQRYELVDIDSSVVDLLRHRSSTGFAARFGDRKMSREPVIGVGDSVDVTIWEASSGGLFSASAAPGQVGTGSNSAHIPEQVVGRDGGITVPYAGRVRVVGQTTRAVQQTIEKALQGKAIQPQALVTVARAASNSVSVGGEVANGARVPLSVGGDRLLDVIATAGGVRAPVNETFVELSRGASTTRTPLARVIANPADNIYMHPGDVVTLVRDPQTFVARGATGRNDEIPFNADGINLSEALAKAGGLEDSRSDRSGVFVFRYENPAVLRQLRPNSPLIESGRLAPVVYRLNLADADSLFLEQAFPIVNGDVVYVSNAPSIEVQKVFGIVGGGLGTAGSVANIVSATSTVK